MSESGFHRPRRVFARNTDSNEPTAVDDTAADSAGASQRGVDPHSSEQAIDESPSGAQGSPADAGGDPEMVSDSPFARPGSESAAAPTPVTDPLAPAPAPVQPTPDFEAPQSDGEQQPVGRPSGGSSPAPRRSAASSTTPPERDPADTTQAPASWVQHHRRTLLIWGIGALVAAILIVFGFYLAGRLGAEEPSPAPPPSPSPSTSVSAVPEVSGEDLLTVADADKIAGGASWAITNTSLPGDELEAKVACLSTYQSDLNPTDTFQRSMGTSQTDALAALHQIDVYANVGAASQEQLQRAEALAACDEVTALIVSSATVTGLGDDVTQLTVAFEDAPTVYRTILLVRTGRALTMLDVTRQNGGVPVIGAAGALVRSLDGICSRVDGMCPVDPVAAYAVPPPVEPTGWLIKADLPRLRPGYGRWNVTEPADVTSKGMGCENLPLATEPGPTSRAQRTYLLTQDDKTPETFGMDEMIYDFEDNTSARAFSTKLITNLLSCKDRVMTAQVTDGSAVNGTGPDGVAISARTILIDQAISDDSSIRFQLVVSIADTRVSYVLATVTDTYEFSYRQRNALALRTAQRLSQG